MLVGEGVEELGYEHPGSGGELGGMEELPKEALKLLDRDGQSGKWDGQSSMQKILASSTLRGSMALVSRMVSKTTLIQVIMVVGLDTCLGLRPGVVEP